MLGPLRSKVVFPGGSAVGFHITDKAEPEIRATKDVDIIVDVASGVDFHQLEKILRELALFGKYKKTTRLVVGITTTFKQSQFNVSRK